MVFVHANHVVELALVGRLQRFVEAVCVVGQQANKNVLLFLNDAEVRHGQLRRRHKKRVPTGRLGAEVHQLLAIQAQVAPTALQLVVLQREVDAVPVEQGKQGSVQLPLLASLCQRCC